MDFGDTPKEAAYRAVARAWLASEAQLLAESGAAAISPETEEWAGIIPAIRAWQARKYDAGYGAISWPTEYGGQGGDEMQEIIFQQEERRFAVPPSQAIASLARLVLSAIRAFGVDRQKVEFMKPGLRADHVWCQLFSEPGAGSDLGGLRTRARPDGGAWLIDGSKIWTTGAHYADFGLLVARSDFDAPKHKGLTCFIVPMKTPGISTSPLKQMTGSSNFNQVFFDTVRIPDQLRLGPVNKGWQVAMSALTAERISIAGGGSPVHAVLQLLQIARQAGSDDGGLRDLVADCYVRAAGAENTIRRLMTTISRGEASGLAASALKLANSCLQQEAASAAIDLADQWGVIVDPVHALATGAAQANWLSSPSGRLAGGTDEIQKSLIAERILGLPGDMRVDKNLPFREAPARIG